MLQGESMSVTDFQCDWWAPCVNPAWKVEGKDTWYLKESTSKVHPTSPMCGGSSDLERDRVKCMLLSGIFKM